MAASEATGSGFEARAGTLTLFFMTSAEEPETLLELLERALSGGLLGPDEDAPPDEDDPLDEDGLDEDEPPDEDEPDDDELYGEFDDDETMALDSGGVALDSGGVAAGLEGIAGHEPRMRTSSKGAQALFVASILERWLRNCPDGPLAIGPSGSEAMASLVCCWSATVIHALAKQPLTLAELDRAVGILDYETAEEHVEAMARAGQVEALPGDGETRYAVTDWLREGIAPIAASARFERRYPEAGMAPPDILDVEAAFQLALPLLKLPPDLRGCCRLGVQMPGGPPLLAGATAEVAEGRVVSSSTLLEEDPETFATGSPLDWLDTLIDPAAGRIKAGGDTRLAQALLDALHEKLFAVPAP